VPRHLLAGSRWPDLSVESERLFFEVDGHPNATGDALIARLVLSHLEQNGSQYGLN
jgi:hypothetical protein